MRKLSITSKITIWYTVFLVVIAMVFVFTVSYAENNRIKENIKNKLIESVVEASEDIEESGEDFIIDKELDYREGGVYISVYSGSGKLLEGFKPAELQNLPELKDRSLCEVEDSSGKSWYVYDSIFEVGNQYIWVRGITENYTGGGFGSGTVKFMLMALPTLILIAAVGGFAIAKKSLEPLREVVGTAKQIAKDGNLSRRVTVPDAKDEISEAAGAFNETFDSLEKVFEEEKQFTSDVSHELRTPIAVISTQSQYALEDKAYRVKALRTINNEAKRMMQLVNRLLVLSRSDSGRLVLEREKMNFSEICRNIAEQQEMTAAEMGISLNSEIEDGVDIEGDEAMIIRIILNLLDNAMKYGCPDGGNITFTMKTEADSLQGYEAGKAKKWAVCSVSDDGPGIPEEEQSKIWNRFFRGDVSRNDSSSSGLGLSMVKSLTEAHGGRVSVDCPEGGGCTFVVKLPM